MNADLPEMPFWQARSFWAQVLLVLSVLLGAVGVDLNKWLAQIGLADQERLIDALVIVAPVVFGAWSWFERRAPKFRLVLWK